MHAEAAQRPAGADAPAQEEPALQPSALPTFIRERIRDCNTNKPLVLTKILLQTSGCRVWAWPGALHHGRESFHVA